MKRTEILKAGGFQVEREGKLYFVNICDKPTSAGLSLEDLGVLGGVIEAAYRIELKKKLEGEVGP